MRITIIRGLVVGVTILALAGCGTESSDPTPGDSTASTSTSTTTSTVETTTSAGVVEPAHRFRIDVWADNWFSLHVNGEFVGEDSVPITTERSFNAESFEFEAAYPLTLAIEAKDFRENDTGLEYIGTDRQQMGDGGLIAQVIDLDTGQVVAVTDGTWAALVIHRAPLNPSCEKSANPEVDCTSEITPAPDGWTEPGFDDSAWDAATEWTAAAVDPKDGYADIDWDASARFVWGSDLEIDNTVLLRSTWNG